MLMLIASHSFTVPPLPQVSDKLTRRLTKTVHFQNKAQPVVLTCTALRFWIWTDDWIFIIFPDSNCGHLRPVAITDQHNYNNLFREIKMTEDLGLNPVEHHRTRGAGKEEELHIITKIFLFEKHNRYHQILNPKCQHVLVADQLKQRPLKGGVRWSDFNTFWTP